MIKDRFFRSFKSVWGILLWVLLLIVLAFGWVFLTNSGSSFVLNRAMPAIGAKMGSVNGSIMRGLQIDTFELENEAMRIEAKNVEIAVRWRDLWRSKAHVSLFSVDELRVELLQRQVEAEVTESSPFNLPELPVEVLIDKIILKRFAFIQADGSTLPVELGDLGLSGIKWTQESAGLVLDGIHIDHPMFNSLLKGDVQLDQLGNPDWPLQINLYSSNQGKIIKSPLCLNPNLQQSQDTSIQADLACNLDVNLSLKGSLKELALELAGSGQEVVLEGTGLINIFAPLLLDNLDFTFKVPNSTELSAKLASEHLADGVQKLSGVVQANRVDLSDIQANSMVGGQLALSTEASGLNQWKQADLRLQLNPSSVWNGQTLSGDIDLAMDLRQVFTAAAVQDKAQADTQAPSNQGIVLEDVIFERANIDVQIGENQIKTQGQFGQVGDELSLNVALPNMEQVWPKIGYAAEVIGSLNGSAREHALDLRGFYQIADTQELGQAPIRFRLMGNGAGKDLLQTPFWRGSLDSLYVSHLDFVLESQEPTALEVVLDEALQWQVGQSAMTLQVPGGQKAQIAHQGSSQSGAVLSSIGEVKNLAVSQKLMTLLGLPLDEKNRTKAKYDDVLYGIKWNVAQSPALHVQLEVERDGQRFLPINPDIPLDVKQFNVQLKQTENTPLYHLSAQGQGEKSSLDIDLRLDAKTPLVVQQGRANLELSDQSYLRLQAQTQVLGQGNSAPTQSPAQTDTLVQAQSQTQGQGQDIAKGQARQVELSLETHELDLYALSLGAVKQAKLSTQLQAQSTLDAQNHIVAGQIKGGFLPGSRWLGQDLQGHLRGAVDLQAFWQAHQQAQAKVAQDKAEAADSASTTALEEKQAPSAASLPNNLSAHYEAAQLKDVDIDLRVGEQQIRAQGDLGQVGDALMIQVDVPTLAQLVPDLHGGVQLKADLQGQLYNHQLNADLQFTPNLKQKEHVLVAQVKAQGGSPEKRLDVWAYEVQQLQTEFADLGLALQDALNFKYTGEQQLLSEQAAQGVTDSASVIPAIWEVGPAKLHLFTPNGRTANIEHTASKGQGQNIQSKGLFSELSLSQAMYERLLAMIDTLSTGANLATSPASLRDNKREMVFKGHWDIDTSKPMLADILIERTDGQGVWPFNTPVPFDFDRLALQATPRIDEPGFDVKINARGQNSHLNSTLWLDSNNPLVLQDGDIDLVLPDKTGLKGFAKVTRSGLNGDTKTIDLDLDASQLALDKLSYGAVPSALINGKIKGQARLSDSQGLLSANLHADFGPGSIWNKQKLAGKADVNLTRLLMNQSAAPVDGFDPHVYLIEQADVDLQIGSNVIKSSGAFGKVGDVLNLDIRAPRLAELYPGLDGGALLKGQLKGAINNHEIDLVADYVQKGSLNAKGAQPIHAEIGLLGGWGLRAGNLQGWSGAITKLNGSFQGFSLRQDQVAGVYFMPVGSQGQPEWNLGAASFTLQLPGNHTVKLQQLGSTGKDGLWTSKGAIKRFVVSPKVINDVNKMLGDLLPASNASEQRGGVIVRNPHTAKAGDLIFDIDWDLGYNGVLLGDVSVQRVSGDILVPTESPFLLGLTQLGSTLKFQQTGPNTSVLQGDLQIQTRDKGNVAVNLRSEFRGLQPNLAGGTSVQAKGNIQDIAWASVFTNDLLSLGGALDFDVALQSRANGQWDSRGQINGRNLRIVEIENGVRLLDGTLRGSFNNTTVTIDSLHFPSVIRVVPSEWRTRQWIEENPPAQNGSLHLSGKWDIARSRGDMTTILDHYPIIQRADRFAMVSGQVTMDAALPRVVLEGKVTADAGWASIDILDTIPAVDGDVVVLKPGQTEYKAPPASTTDLAMNLTVDLGPRFYLVGMGLNSGLVGSINLLQEQGRLTAEGEFRTRGGAIEAYGQRLQIRRGQIAFSGNITNPTLNIEAIRTGTEVEAGLRVIGTAKNPKITLVSYPDVSEVEKLSWLIMGRGPDSSGADLALLFSVGTSLIGGEEPFYRKLGIDDIGVSSGGVGDSDNILPDRTVADSTAYRGYGEEDQFFYASKKFGDSWRINLEQALTGTGTVLRGSYLLMRHLTVDLKVGTVNGLEFVYKRFFAD